MLNVTSCSMFTQIEVSDMLVQQMISDYLLYNGYGKTHTALKKVTNTCNFDPTSKSNLAVEKISRTPTSDDKAERKNRRKSMSDCDSGSDTHRKLFPCPFCSFIPLANLDFVESQENYKIKEIICKCCTHRYAVSVSEIEVKDGTQKGSKIPNVDDMKNADVEDKTSSTRYCEPLIRLSSGDDSADVNVGNRDNRRVDRDGEIDSETRNERNSIRRFFASLLQQASSSSSGSNPPRMATDQASNARSIRQVLSHRRSADIARSHPDHDSSPFLQSVSRQVTWRDSLEQDESPMETDTNSTTLLREGERRENRNVASSSSGGSGLGGDGRRGLTLDDTRRLRRSLVLHEHDALNDLISAAEGTPPMDTDTSNDLSIERGKGRENYVSSSLLCTALPPLDVDVHSLLLPFPPPLTSLPDSVTKATSDNIVRDQQFLMRALEDTLDFRTKIRRMLRVGEVENVIDELLAMDKGDMSETRQDFRETVALRSSPAWIYLNVLLFIRLLSSENKAGESDWKGYHENEGEEKDEKVLLETKDDDDDNNNLNSLERAIEIGRRELFFLIDPNRSCTNANTSTHHSGTGFGFVGSSGNGYSYRSIGAGELRGVRSESWHVWNFYSCSSDGSSSKKRARDNMDGEDSAAGNDLSNGIGSNSAQKCSTQGSIDNEPRRTLFACTSFEYQVLAKLVKDVVALLVIPPPTLRGLSRIYNERLNGNAFNSEGTGMDNSPTTSNKALQGESAFSNEKLFDSIPCDYFLHSNFVDLVADSVNSYVLSRCQHFSPCSTNSTNCYLSYHTALETCVAQLHCLQVSSQSKSPNPRTTTIENISARNCKGNGMKHFHLYNTHPVIWPCCHPPS